MITKEWRLDVRLRDPHLLQMCMEHKEYSVRELAAAVGADRSTIGHLRSGKRSSCKSDLAKAIAKKLDVKLDLLFLTMPSSVSREMRRVA